LLLGWVHEVPGDCDYTGGRQGEELPFYAVQFRLPRGRVDDLAKAYGVRDRTSVVLEAEDAEGAPNTQENPHRLWIPHPWNRAARLGNREWARSYISALDETEPAGRRFS
jgi:hypothetical protein